jgi:hypothetical protein
MVGIRSGNYSPKVYAHLIRRIGYAVRRLDVVKNPRSPAFRYKLPAQDLKGLNKKREHRSHRNPTYPVLSQIHICCEDICTGSMLRALSMRENG